MRKRSLIAALCITFLLAVLSLCLQKRAVPTSRMAVDEGTIGIDANWREIITVEVPCDPQGWRNVIVFELRDGDEVVSSQELETGCQVVCDGQYAERCGQVVAPVWDSIPKGVYQIWYKPFWINEEKGIEVISHPPSATGLDARQFKWLNEHVISAPASKVIKIYLPIVMR